MTDKKSSAAPKRVALIFLDDWIHYSSFTINLYNELGKNFEAILLTTHSASAKNIDSERVLPNAIFVNQRSILKSLIVRLHVLIDRFLLLFPIQRHYGKPPFNLIGWYFSLIICWELHRFKPDHVIVADFVSMWHTQFWFRKKHFLSLEIRDFDAYQRKDDETRFCSVLSQSSERIDYQFPQWRGPRFFAPNSRVFVGRCESPKSDKLVLAGTIIWDYGLRHILDYLQDSGRGCVFHGWIADETRNEIQERYPKLIANRQLEIRTNYIPHHAMAEFLSPFYLGFAFFDQAFEKMRRFSCRHGSSAKIYTYLAAGVPVICSDVPGMRFVQDEGCGETLVDISARSIAVAVDRIAQDYAQRRENCFRVAEACSFDQEIKPFLKHLRIA